MIARSEAVRCERSGLPSGPVLSPSTSPVEMPEAPLDGYAPYIEVVGTISVISPPQDIGKIVPPGPELELGPNPESDPCMLEVDTLPMLLTTPNSNCDAKKNIYGIGKMFVVNARI